MAWWKSPAPVEPSAAERAAPTTYFTADQCAACRSRREPRHAIRAGEYEVEVCSDPVACRRRATEAGIYGQVA